MDKGRSLPLSPRAPDVNSMSWENPQFHSDFVQTASNFGGGVPVPPQTISNFGGEIPVPPHTDVNLDVPDHLDLGGCSSPRLLGSRTSTNVSKSPNTLVSHGTGSPRASAPFQGVQPRLPGREGFGEWNPCGKRPDEAVEAGTSREAYGLCASPHSFTFSDPQTSKSKASGLTGRAAQVTPTFLRPWPSVRGAYATKGTGRRQLSEAGRQVFLYDTEQGSNKNTSSFRDDSCWRRRCLRPKLWWLLFGTFIAVILVLLAGLFSVSFWSLEHSVQEMSEEIQSALQGYAERSRSAIQSLATDLDQRDVDSAKTAIERYINVPLMTVQMMGEGMKDEFGLIIPNNPKHSAKYLWSLYKTLPLSIEGLESKANRQRFLEGVFYADYTGTYVAYINQCSRGSDGTPCAPEERQFERFAVDLRAGNQSRPEDFEGWALGMTLDDQVHFYSSDSLFGTPLHRFGSVQYDPLQRPWWKDAVSADGLAAWTEVYDDLLYEDGGHPDIGFSVAIAKFDGNRPSMVAGAQLTLAHMTLILQEQETSDTKCLFIVDRKSGKMIASSQGFEKVVCRKPTCDSTRQLHWSEVERGCVTEAMHALLADNGGTLDDLPDRKVLPTDRQTVSHSLINHGRSDFTLSWVLVHVQPSDIYTKEVNAELNRAVSSLDTSLDNSNSSLKSSLYRIGSVCLIFIFVGMICLGFISHLVTKPIKAVVNDMKAVARLDLDNMDSMLRTEQDTLFRWTNYLGFRIREVAEMRETFVSMTNGLRSFSRYMDPYVVQLVMMSGQQAQLGVAKAEATIFFSDIKGFTSIAETTEPPLLLSMLSEYLETMSGIIMKHQGVVGEFIGDGIMAWWNVPWELEDDTHSAFIAALEQKQKLAELRPYWQQRGLPEIHARMGIARGTVLAGNIGSVNRMKFGLVGDSVNLASRLENMCKQYEVQILVDEHAATARGIADKFYLRPVDIVRVKGRTSPTEVFELVGEKSRVGVTALEKMYSKYCTDFAAVHRLYRSRNFEAAQEALHAYMETWQDDAPSRMMQERLKDVLETPFSPTSWSPVRNLTEK